MGLARRLCTALAVASMVGMVAPQGVAASAGRSDQEAADLRMVRLTGPVGDQVQVVKTLNEQGQVIGRVLTPAGIMGGVMWDDLGQASYVAPWWTPWTTPSDPQDISDEGHIAGNNTSRSGTPGQMPVMTPFSWQDGMWTDLPAQTSQAGGWAVNRRGQVIGMDGVIQEATVVAWLNGRRVVAPAEAQGLSVSSWDLNDRGQAVLGGMSAMGPITPRVVLWDLETGRATELDLGLPAGTVVTSAGINARGQVIVVASIPSQGARRYLWDGEVVDLGPYELPLGNYDRNSKPLNDQGHAVVQRTTADNDVRAYLWRDGEVTDLGTLGGSHTRARAVNDRDEVVGFSTTADRQHHAFLWRDGRMTDLGAVHGQGESSTIQINDAGQVLGSLTRPDGTQDNLLWTPRSGA